MFNQFLQANALEAKQAYSPANGKKITKTNFSRAGAKSSTLTSAKEKQLAKNLEKTKERLDAVSERMDRLSSKKSSKSAHSSKKDEEYPQ